MLIADPLAERLTGGERGIHDSWNAADAARASLVRRVHAGAGVPIARLLPGRAEIDVDIQDVIDVDAEIDRLHVPQAGDEESRARPAAASPAPPVRRCSTRCSASRVGPPVARPVPSSGAKSRRARDERRNDRRENACPERDDRGERKQPDREHASFAARGSRKVDIADALQRASTIAPPRRPIASSAPSTSHCRITRHRVAPSDRRSATSRDRVRPRSSSRFATFADAISNTSSDTAATHRDTDASAFGAGPRAAMIDPSSAFDFPNVVSYLGESRQMLRYTRVTSLASWPTGIPGATLGDDLQPVAPHPRIHRPRAEQPRRHAERKPKIDAIQIDARESSGRDADDDVRQTGDVDRAAQHGGVAVEPASPRVIPEHRDVIRLVALLSRQQRTAPTPAARRARETSSA